MTSINKKLASFGAFLLQTKTNGRKKLEKTFIPFHEPQNKILIVTDINR